VDEKEGRASAKLDKVKKKVDSDSDDDSKPAAKGGGVAAKRAELVGLDTTSKSTISLRHKSAGDKRVHT
jgi:hypothetical protein